MNQQKRIVIFHEKSGGHRKERFLEEAQRKNIKLIFISTDNLLFTEKEIYDENGKLLHFDSNDILWFVSNSFINHQLIKKLESVAGFVWPSSSVLEFANKFQTSIFFAKNNIPTPKTILLNTGLDERAIQYLGGFPMVIKKNIGSGGIYVQLINSLEETAPFIKKSLEKGLSSPNVPRGDRSFSLQEFITESTGEDFRVLCLRGKAIGAIKRSSENDFRANVSLGGKAEGVELTKELKELSEKIALDGNLFFAGIDFIRGKSGYLAIEINTSAQFQGFEAATNINIAERIIDALLESSTK